MFSAVEVELLMQAEIDGRRAMLENPEDGFRRELDRERGRGGVGVWATVGGWVRAVLAVARSAGARTAVVQ